MSLAIIRLCIAWVNKHRVLNLKIIPDIQQSSQHRYFAIFYDSDPSNQDETWLLENCVKDFTNKYICAFAYLR